MTQPYPQRIMQFATGGWASALLGTAVTHSLFTHIEQGATSAEALAERTRLSLRGIQALLDGLLGLGLLGREGGTYRNAPDAATYLVQGKPQYIGGYARHWMMSLPLWAQLPRSVETGQPARAEGFPRTHSFWEELVLSLVPLTLPTARAAAEHVGLARAGAVRILDVGGGSGVFAGAWLGMNPLARATQVDQAEVNRVARNYVAKLGVANRFETVDGDFHQVDFGEACYDFAIYSQVAHGESPEGNQVLLRKVRRALQPGGTLVISDVILEDDRTGHPFALMFSANMLLGTPGGSSWRRADFREWLHAAGFTEFQEHSLAPSATSLLLAR